MTMSETKLGQESRPLAEKVNKTVELCAEDAGHCKAQLKEFIKENKDRFTENDINLLLDLLDSLDLGRAIEIRERRPERHSLRQ